MEGAVAGDHGAAGGHIVTIIVVPALCAIAHLAQDPYRVIYR